MGIVAMVAPPGLQKYQQSSQFSDIARVLAIRLVQTGGTNGACNVTDLEASQNGNLLAA
jgi:hypothetical protein